MTGSGGAYEAQKETHLGLYLVKVMDWTVGNFPALEARELADRSLPIHDCGRALCAHDLHLALPIVASMPLSCFGEGFNPDMRNQVARQLNRLECRANLLCLGKRHNMGVDKAEIA